MVHIIMYDIHNDMTCTKSQNDLDLTPNTMFLLLSFNTQLFFEYPVKNQSI